MKLHTADWHTVPLLVEFVETVLRSRQAMLVLSKWKTRQMAVCQMEREREREREREGLGGAVVLFSSPSLLFSPLTFHSHAHRMLSLTCYLSIDQRERERETEARERLGLLGCY